MKFIQKRNGSLVPFNVTKIEVAINKAAADVYGHSTWEAGKAVAEAIADKVASTEQVLTVEQIQDEVEFLLMGIDGKVAKSYILYRNERNKARKDNPYTFISSELVSKYKHLPDPFPSELGKIVYYITYARPVES